MAAILPYGVPTADGPLWNPFHNGPAATTTSENLHRRFCTLSSFAPTATRIRCLQAVELLQNLNQERRRAVPADAPLKFVPTKWHPYVVDGSGRIDRRYYELCVLWELRAALRAGDVWLEGSRRYANPESHLIPPAHWRRRHETEF